MTTQRTPITRVYDAEHRMPPVRPYLRETMSHLQFAYEKARLDLKAAHKDTWFGRLWNIMNPLLLGIVYWILVMVIFQSGGDDPLRVLTQILGGLFVFALPSGALSLGARSVIGGGTFVLNTRIPRLILPIGSLVSAFLNFLPSMGVYALFHLLAGYPVGLELLWSIPIVLLLCVIAFGLATVFATLNVYFRDVASFLPYVTRIWMYLTPIIYLYTFITDKGYKWAILANPIGGVFTSWQQAVYQGVTPSVEYMGTAVLWSVVLALGGVYLFLRRERDFAVRI